MITILPRVHLRYCFVVVATLFLAFFDGRVLAEDGRVVAFGAKIAGDDTSTRLLVDLDRQLAVKSFYMDQPDRIIIDLPETIFNFAEDTGLEPRGLISFLRYGSINNKTSRIVVSLQSPARISGLDVRARSQGEGFRLVLDLDAISASEYEKLVNVGREEALNALSEEKVSDPEPKPKNNSVASFTIVLDPGHGGIDGGAVGKKGTLEKDIVLSFSRKLKDELARTGNFNVVVTRDNDEFISLKKRLELSRNAEANLFISIHADSLRERHVRGSTVYTLSKKASDRLSEELAQSENSVDLVAGLTLEHGEEEFVTDILAELTTRETKQFSNRFSSILVGALKDRVTLIKNPRRSASFSVLKAPDVPGILLELGYLSNPEDEKLLSDPKWQEEVARIVSSAVVKYFEPRMEN